MSDAPIVEVKAKLDSPKVGDKVDVNGTSWVCMNRADIGIGDVGHETAWYCDDPLGLVFQIQDYWHLMSGNKHAGVFRHAMLAMMAHAKGSFDGVDGDGYGEIPRPDDAEIAEFTDADIATYAAEVVAAFFVRAAAIEITWMLWLVPLGAPELSVIQAIGLSIVSQVWFRYPTMIWSGVLTGRVLTALDIEITPQRVEVLLDITAIMLSVLFYVLSVFFA